MKKTAVVIGGTGLIGKNLVQYLINADHIEKIIVVTRSEHLYSSEKVENKIVNFENLNEYQDCFMGDILFSCLGTTIKKAGSIEAQRLVDFGYQFEAAKIASEKGISEYSLVSSAGADSNSSNGYLKIKGDLEDAVSKLPFKSITFFRPSLLMGKREEFRFGEKIGALLMPLLCRLPGFGKYRPIKGREVAEKMMIVSRNPLPGITIYELDEIFNIF